VGELRVTVRVLGPFGHLGVGLQAIAQVVQHPAFETGWGHKAARPAAMVEEGKISIFGDPMTDRPTGVWEPDVRVPASGVPAGSVDRVDPAWWELNWAAAPLSMFRRLGGFDEAMDAAFYSCDNLAVSKRAERLGYGTFIDWTNECVGFPHQLYWPRPADWDEKHGRFGKFEEWFEQWVADGQPRLPYLSEPG